MTSFGWKRKAGERLSAQGPAGSFKRAPESDDEDEAIKTGDVDWLMLARKPKVMVLENAALKSKRLASEGAVLAEAERYWEAQKKWDEALQLTPGDEKIYEMKAQAYMSLNEVFPAITAATKAVELNTLWWPAYQTLGRAHLGLGEVRLAVKSFSRALHLNPAEEELRQEDLAWACDLLAMKDRKQQELKAAKKKGGQTQDLQIEIIEDISVGEDLGQQTACCNYSESEANSNGVDSDGGELQSMHSIPCNYVAMRDSF